MSQTRHTSQPRLWSALVLSLGLAAAMPALAAGQAPGVTATVAPDKVRLGEPFRYSIVVTRPNAERFDLAPGKELGAFSVLSIERRREDGPTTATTHLDLTMALYELGPHRLPDLALDAAGPAGRSKLPVIGPEVQGVTTLTAKGEKLRDIQGPGGVTIRSWRPVIVASALLALVVPLLLFVRLWRRRRLPLDKRTRAALDALNQETLPNQGRIQDFYFQLDDIVRRHLGERYAFDALECTTAQLLRRLRQLPVDGLPHDELGRFFSDADLVKFACASVEMDACREALAFGYRLLDTTPPLLQDRGTHARAALS